MFERTAEYRFVEGLCSGRRLEPLAEWKIRDRQRERWAGEFEAARVGARQDRVSPPGQALLCQRDGGGIDVAARECCACCHLCRFGQDRSRSHRRVPDHLAARGFRCKHERCRNDGRKASFALARDRPAGRFVLIESRKTEIETVIDGYEPTGPVTFAEADAPASEFLENAGKRSARRELFAGNDAHHFIRTLATDRGR